MIHVVLVEPEIPPNTGAIARLCCAAAAKLHLVEPLGFSLDDRALRRAGMDYVRQCDMRIWPSLGVFWESATASRFFLFTTKGSRPYWEQRFRPGDALIFGRETRGLPESLLAAHAEKCLTIPMAPGTRSLNLATAVAIALFEATRQLAASGSPPFPLPG